MLNSGQHHQRGLQGIGKRREGETEGEGEVGEVSPVWPKAVKGVSSVRRPLVTRCDLL